MTLEDVSKAGAPATVGPARGAAHVVLHAKDRCLSGSGGCNRLAGGSRLEGAKLTFGHIASTRTACPEGMQQEQEFLSALKQVTRWKVTGPHLELCDEVGACVARFEAVTPRR